MKTDEFCEAYYDIDLIKKKKFTPNENLIFKPDS